MVYVFKKRKVYKIQFYNKKVKRLKGIRYDLTINLPKNSPLPKLTKLHVFRKSDEAQGTKRSLRNYPILGTIPGLKKKR